MSIGNFGDLLGAGVGFVTVMLLLSLVVTGLVQSLTSALRLRARVTRIVLKQFLREELDLEPVAVRYVAGITLGSFVERKRWRLMAGPTQPAQQAALTEEQRTQEKWRWISPFLESSPAKRRLFLDEHVLSNGRTELAWDELRACLVGIASSSVLQRAEDRFDRLKAHVSDRYAAWMRVCSVLGAFCVAGAFQVSATKLLRDLSTSDDLRARAAAVAADVGDSSDPPARMFRVFSANALDEVAGQHPELLASLEELSYASDNEEEILAELGRVLDGAANGDRFIAEYVSALRRLESAESGRQRAPAGGANADLAKLDIKFAEDFCFYLECPPSGSEQGPRRLRLGNIMGVLLTGFFLTFGAPFWYEQLKKVRVFQSSLRGVIGRDEAKAEVGSTRAQAPEHLRPWPTRSRD